jgi:hypothetical protein
MQFSLSKGSLLILFAGIVSNALLTAILNNLASLLLQSLPYHPLRRFFYNSITHDMGPTAPLSLLAFFLSGMLVGHFAKNNQKGWMYALLAGIIAASIYISLNLLGLPLDTHAIIIYLQIYPYVIVSSALGGWVGERLKGTPLHVTFTAHTGEKQKR